MLGVSARRCLSEIKMDKNQISKKICVLGSGAWGTAIADLLAGNGNSVIVYGIKQSEIDDINLRRKNSAYFGDEFTVCDGVCATNDLTFAVSGADIVIFAVPSFAIKQSVISVKNLLKSGCVLVNLAKGFDEQTELPLAATIKNNLLAEHSKNVVSLIGPSFAKEVAAKEKTAIIATGENKQVLQEVQKTFSNGYFKVYLNDDPVGAEYCAALKNVIALACGIADGIGCKVNTRAALITRGLAEIVRFVKFFGGNEKTCFGLAGVGDLVLTCSSRTSRNYSAGVEIGESSADVFFKNNKKTVEGVFACKIAKRIADENGIYAPIINSVYSVLFCNATPQSEIERLMRSELKSE